VKYYLQMDESLLERVRYSMDTFRCKSKEELFPTCALIARHDAGHTRIPLYDALSPWLQIQCPSVLLHNADNTLLDTLGKQVYLSSFTFHICSENFIDAHAGYTTEKLFDACLAQCIPIVWGDVLDSTDRRIFNLDRMVYGTSMPMIVEKIQSLLESPETWVAFYNQPPFQPEAVQVLQEVTDQCRQMVHTIENQIQRRSSLRKLQY
jgi:hypothetical protein